MISWLVILLLVGVAAGFLALRPRDGIGWAWLCGLILVYVGQRLLGDDTPRLAASLAGVGVVAASIAVRFLRRGDAAGPAADAHRDALLWQSVGAGALALWWLSTPAATGMLGLGDDTAARWSAVLSVLWPILVLCAGLVVALLDGALAAHPVHMPPGARTQAVAAGLSLGLGLSLVFPLNYLADAHDVDADFSYFRVTAPGSSTLALVRTLDAPTEALLFFPPGNDVRKEVEPYFNAIADASGGTLSVRAIDQAAEPGLAKELSVRDNGHIVLRQGERTQKFKLDAELKRARRDLRKLDGTVQENLLRLVSPERVAYILTGHGEASPRAANPLEKLGDLKKLLLSQNYEVKDFGLEQGSGDAVPEDAALVIVASPEQTLLDAESAALTAYIDRGGRLLIYADPGRSDLAAVLGHLGLAVGEHPLAHGSRFVRLSGGIADRFNLFSQRYGSHAAVSTLSKYASKAFVAFLSAVPVREAGEPRAPGPAKRTPLIRTYEQTWEDADGDAEQGAGEVGGVHVLAMAVEGPEAHPYRAIVVGDAQSASDVLIQRVQGNAQFLLDGVRWLVGDEELSGEVNNEEDVRIEHTREDDIAWFYGMIFGIPLLVLGAGAVLVRRRQRG